MGKYGFHVIDADGHGGERSDWMDQVPESVRPRVAQYRDRIRTHYGRLPIPGGGLARQGDKFQERPGMSDPAARAADMDLEGIDVTVTFPRGSGEEWALDDRDFAIALCRAINDAKAAFNRNDPARFKGVAKLPLIDPQAAVAELRRAVTELGLVAAVVPQHVRQKNLNDPSFDPVWAEAERLGVPVCVHGGGQAVDQVPVAIDRFNTRLEVHAITHPVGNMIALDCFIVGGVLHRFPKLRVAFLESGCGWLPFWLERLDEHWEKMPDQAPAIDRKPSEYFQDGRCFISCDPDERMIPDVARLCGDDKVVYASDYYHWDCAFPDSVRLIAERTDLSERTKKKILGDNAARLFNL
jgi:predicted TIM-barrel fold metal-dependent hydrolase